MSLIRASAVVQRRSTRPPAALQRSCQAATSATASKFAGEYAFQFTVVNRGDAGVEIDWDHLREMQAGGAPSVQKVAGGTAYVFLSPKRPREALSTVVLRTKSGKALGRFRFDGFRPVG